MKQHTQHMQQTQHLGHCEGCGAKVAEAWWSRVLRKIGRKTVSYRCSCGEAFWEPVDRFESLLDEVERFKLVAFPAGVAGAARPCGCGSGAGEAARPCGAGSQVGAAGHG